MRTSSVKAKISLAALLLPMLSVYVMTVSCAMGNLLPCCDDMAVETMAVNTQSEHHDHTDGHKHGHSKNAQSSEHGHHDSSKEEDCCNDLSAGFFHIFQAQHRVLYVAKEAGFLVPRAFTSAIRILNTASSNYLFPVYCGFKLPLKTKHSGVSIRIFQQSFLN